MKSLLGKFAIYTMMAVGVLFYGAMSITGIGKK